MANVPWSAKHAVIRTGVATTSLTPTTPNVLINSGWDIDPETNWDPTDHMDAGGFGTSVACMERAQVHAEGWLDANLLISDTPLSIIDGQQISSKFFANTTVSPNFIFPTLNIKRTPYRARPTQAMRYEFNAETSGQWLIWTGVVPTP